MFDYLETHRKKLIYLPLIIYWILLLFATTLPARDLPPTGVSDKLEHFVAYFGLAVFLNLTLLLQTRFIFLKKHSHLLTALIIAVYAALDEIHQLFIPGRYCDILDWTADVIGAVLGILLVVFLVKLFKFRRESQLS